VETFDKPLLILLAFSIELRKLGFCNGPLFVNPFFPLARYPFAGVVLLYGVSAQAAT
jgi:hypothetical protein